MILLTLALLLLINTSLLQTAECRGLETESYEDENEGSEYTENNEFRKLGGERDRFDNSQYEGSRDNEIADGTTDRQDKGEIEKGEKPEAKEGKEKESNEEEGKEEEGEESGGEEEESEKEGSKESKESSEMETDECDGEEASSESGDSSSGESIESDDEESLIGSFKRKASDINIQTIVDLIKSTKGDSIGPSTKIVGGKNSDIKNHPWQVSLQFKETGFHFCGGVIVHEHWVLTAAHCINDKSASDIKVVAGTTDRTVDRIQSDVKRLIPHENYNQGPGDWSNDVGLIELESDLTSYDAVTTIPISPSLDVDKSFVNEMCTISGWGLLTDGSIPTILQEADMKALSNCHCRRFYGDHVYGPAHFCAYNQGVSACSGDSGGPLVCDGTLVGVFSFFNHGCSTLYPSVYTRLSSYRSWMKDQTGIDFEIVPTE